MYLEMKRWIGRGLLFFVIFTLGFGLGKERGLRLAVVRNMPPPCTATETRKVIVYYLHATFRCATCNSIEKLARQVVEEEFGKERAAGRIEWRMANFQEREDLAARYAVAASTVVVVDIKDGVEKGFKRLDDVWTLYDRPEAFTAYVGGAIREFLREEP